MEFINILRYGFLAIFFATAVIGIASIPGWIVIPEWYRKRIFVALVLEVVGAIVIIFRQEFIISGAQGIPAIEISHNDWAALDEHGRPIVPELTVKTQETTLVLPLGNRQWEALDGLQVQTTKNGLSICNADGEPLGFIASSDAQKAGLFNAFRTAKNEITSTENYAYIKWEKVDDGSWQQKGSFLKPFVMQVYDDPTGTYYRIRNSANGKQIFDSQDNAKDLIDEDNRIIHFLEHENVYYLIRISWADLGRKQKTKYVYVINVKMQPYFKIAQ
jgi:hypothetical protein